ncbi:MULTISPECIES: phosphopantetheine-binding protein [unclassified Gilliamella]|uniref:phosphopantetheine-binding protein n=1 Tax=unclassified Gilliamella TaxID=2685620 RepID=UPI001C699F21|nr:MULTISPECIES: phosphopantetheine-binding protein [unclassified Gilliamella]MCX8601105.1 acyl carrier protein [Gilliamella sp. B3722]MCX8607259.1 acyl carrier protein [Gilliamella sp. B3771]MCX8610552.1 acyl carrier protein [Gilliamella sp. B3891]MCX8612779.1 acyl carrier protein [Gilliamella sp. B3773]MCX8614688.1 acyl carrier protein [Gilliamella sp. B3770]
MEKLQNEIKQIIIDVLNLEDITPADIDTKAPLFGDGLGLDSIDALELGLAIKSNYGIVLSSESEETKKAFYSVQTLADFISAQQ